MVLDNPNGPTKGVQLFLGVQVHHLAGGYFGQKAAHPLRLPDHELRGRPRREVARPVGVRVGGVGEEVVLLGRPHLLKDKQEEEKEEDK